MVNLQKKSSIIRLFHVYKTYSDKNALVDITVDVAQNEFLFISGPSGAGKTTLLKLLYLGQYASQGQILVDGVNIARISKKKIPLFRRKFGIIFQDYKLIPQKTVYHNIALVLEATGKKGRIIPQKIRSVLRTVGMEDRIDMYPPSLSGGEQQRVAVARALATDPKIILADEPTGNLDIQSAGIVLKLLIQFYIRGATVILATHNLELIRKTGGRVVHLKDGKVQAITWHEPIRDF